MTERKRQACKRVYFPVTSTHATSAVATAAEPPDPIQRLQETTVKGQAWGDQRASFAANALDANYFQSAHRQLLMRVI